MKKLLFLFLIPIILLSGCCKSFNKYEFNEARFVRTGEVAYYRVCNEETVPNYSDGWIDTSSIYCKSLKVKYVNDYKNDRYTLVIKYILFSGEEIVEETNIFYNTRVYVDYI